MEYEQIILDVISPLIEHSDKISIVLLEQENLRDNSYIVYCTEDDLPRLIGKRGVIASAIRNVVNAAAKLENKRIKIKFEVRK